MISPSLYSYSKECTIKETTVKTKPQNNLPATGEKVIIAVLRKYGFLTAPLLQRAANIERHRTLKITSSLRKMQQQGKILKYTITHPEEVQDIDVYLLSTELRRKQGFKSIFRYDMTNIPYILEHLSQTQWHLSLLEGENAKELMIYKQIHLKGNISEIPSLIEYKPGFGKKMTILGMTSPKGKRKADLGAFLTKLVSADEYLRNHKEQYGSYLITIICESENQIEEMAKFLGKIAETSELYYLYSIDPLTAEEILDPLSVLYDVQRIDGETILNVVRLRG